MGCGAVGLAVVLSIIFVSYTVVLIGTFIPFWLKGHDLDIGLFYQCHSWNCKAVEYGDASEILYVIDVLILVGIVIVGAGLAYMVRQCLHMCQGRPFSRNSAISLAAFIISGCFLSLSGAIVYCVAMRNAIGYSFYFSPWLVIAGTAICGFSSLFLPCTLKGDHLNHGVEENEAIVEDFDEPPRQSRFRCCNCGKVYPDVSAHSEKVISESSGNNHYVGSGKKQQLQQHPLHGQKRQWQDEKQEDQNKKYLYDDNNYISQAPKSLPRLKKHQRRQRINHHHEVEKGHQQQQHPERKQQQLGDEEQQPHHDSVKDNCNQPPHFLPKLKKKKRRHRRTKQQQPDPSNQLDPTTENSVEPVQLLEPRSFPYHAPDPDYLPSTHRIIVSPAPDPDYLPSTHRIIVSPAPDPDYLPSAH